MNQNYLPDEENGNPFLSLVDLMNAKVSVSTLASAIETHGVYSWDAFGRYKHFKGEEAVKPALDALAEARFMEPEEAAYSQADTFGWASDESPDFGDIKPLPRAADATKRIQTLLAIIDTLADEAEFVIENPGTAKTWADMMSESYKVHENTVKSVIDDVIAYRKKKLKK